MACRSLVIALFALGSLLLGQTAQSAQKHKLIGANKFQYSLYQTASALGDQPGHELVQAASVWSNSANHPDWQNMRYTGFIQMDQVNGSGTHRGHGENLHENGDKNFFSLQGSHKTVAKAGGAWEQLWEGTYTLTTGTGKFKSMTGSGTYTCRFTAEGGACDWQGEHEY
jgi:hypothetical protein